ncbi:teneurin-2 [Enoplosus armatus]|uniref:teneurin-2 n=1 Tax=Enoplosus armatus TaxID=215367 RepID=UPI003995E2F8
MAAVGAEVAGSWFLSAGVFSFFILLLLSIFLTALCSECSRRSFELQEPEDKNPSALVRVVKLEEAMVARENPMIKEIRNDEKEFNSAEANTAPFTPWRSHLAAPQSHHEVQTNGSEAVMKTPTRDPETAGESKPEEESSAPFSPWRSHLRAPQSQDLNSSTPPGSAHIYHTIGGGQSCIAGDADVLSPPTNHEPGEEHSARSDLDRNSVYARVSKKVRLTTPPDHTPEEVQVEEEEEKESSPPLPDRKE